MRSRPSMADHECISPSRSTLAGPEAGALTLPPQLGPVRLIREIGRGAMGVVWLGHHELLKKNVAIKFLSGIDLSDGDRHCSQFLDGARAAAEIRHPGLTLVHDANLLDGVPYLVMDYVDGP